MHLSCSSFLGFTCFCTSNSTSFRNLVKPSLTWTKCISFTRFFNTFTFWIFSKTYVDLMVIHLSCSSFLVSVALVSPAFAPAIIPALDKRESVRVDLPWSTWAITDMFRILCFLSMIPRISSTVKFT